MAGAHLSNSVGEKKQLTIHCCEPRIFQTCIYRGATLEPADQNHECDRQQLPITNHIPYASRLLRALLHFKDFPMATLASFIALLLHIVWEASQTEPSRCAEASNPSCPSAA